MVQFFRGNVKGIIGTLLIVLIASSVALQVQRQNTQASSPESHITADDGVANDWFASSMAIDGNYAIVGAYNKNSATGAAYIFYFDGASWTQQQKLTASDGEANDRFGGGVDISGVYAIIGADGDDDRGTNAGAAYIFKRSGAVWTQLVKIYGSTTTAVDFFGGGAVTIDGSTAVVGASMDDPGGLTNTGSAFVFYRDQGGADNWGEVKVITPGDAAANDNFGFPSINADNVIIGSAKNGNSAYIFNRNSGGADNWGQVKKLSFSEVVSTTGYSISINGDYAIVGIPNPNNAAFVFYKDQGSANNWGQQVKITASGSSTLFGSSVGIYGNYAAVGATGNDSYKGAAYTFKRSGIAWSQARKLTAGDGAANDYFGNGVSISASNVMVGAYYDDVGANANQGSAYFYRKDVTADFTNANFLNCVSTALGTPGSVDADDAATLGALDCSSNSISNIAGAEYLTGLFSLVFYSNTISDLSPVSSLTRLTTLGISNNNISNLSPLSGLTNLSQIFAQNNDIPDTQLTNLSGLTSMTYLYLSNNDNISDISALNGLTNLVSLLLDNNNISNLTPLTGLTNLTNLNLYQNNISNLTPLAVLTNLTSLALGNNSISNLSPIAGLTNLTWLDLKNNAISDLSPIGSGNATIVGFASGNSIDIRNNTGLNGANAPASLAEVAILQLPANGATVTHNINDNVAADFTDPNFLDCVSTALGTPGSVSAAAAAALGALNCDSQSISSIAGAQYLTGLINLSLYNNSISNISALSGMTALNYLQLSSNNISDISALSGLTALRDLRTGNNNISNVSALSGLTNLTRLIFGVNNLSDISPLSGLTNLTDLYLSGNNISDISSLSGLTNLTQFQIDSNNVSNISAVSGMTNLSYLNLSSNNISDLSPVSGLTNLTSLPLRDNNISDLSPIGSGNATLAGFASGNEIIISDNAGLNANVPASIAEVVLLRNNGATVTHNITDDVTADFTDANFLDCVSTALGTPDSVSATAAAAFNSHLYCNGRSISSLAGAEYLTGLTDGWFWFNDNNISDLTPISGLTLLQDVSLTNNNISDLSPLAGALPNLTLIYLENNNISDISPLTGKTTIWDLRLNNNHISDISILSSLTGLFYTLQLRHNNISDISAVSGLTSLRDTLDLGENNISDISPLSALTVSTIALDDNNITNISPLSGLAGVKYLMLQSNNISDLSPLSGLDDLIYIWLMNNNISDLSPIGSGNANLVDFTSGITIDMQNNTELNGLNAPAALAQVALLRANGATVLHNISDDVTADFTDPNFLNCVSIALGTPGSVSATAAAALTSLDCSARGIASIAGAEHLTAIQTLNLDSNSISDISPLSGATSLTYLRFNMNNVSDISSLSGLVNLMTFRFPGNHVSDISVLSGMTNLRTLNANANNFSDISPLTGLTTLTNVELFGNNISDISPLAGLTALTYLNLGGCNISDLSTIGSGNATLAGFASGNNIDIINNLGLNGGNALAALAEVVLLRNNGATVTHNISDNVTADFTDPNFLNCVSIALGTPGSVSATAAAALTSLDCSSRSISSIAGAQYLTGLTYLTFYNNSISNLSPLSGLTNLTHLELRYNNITDISLLSGLTDLTYLALGNNDITNITPLSGLTDLITLWLGNNNVTDLSPLIGLSNLDYLNLEVNGISDLSDLSGMTSVTHLFLFGNNFNNSELNNLPSNLTHLGLGNNNIIDISPLSGLADLTDLELNWNNVSDLTPLGGLTNLTILSLGSNDINNISPLSGMTNLTDLSLWSNNISDISPLAGLTNLTSLTLQYNDIIDLSPIGSANANLADFASGNHIDVSDNPLIDQGDLDEVALLEANGATVTQNIVVTCGNGNLDASEQCDDGNTNNGDGCSSECLFEEVKITAGDCDASDYFGRHVAMDGNYAVVGVPNKELRAMAYIYQKISGVWTQIKKVTGVLQTSGTSEESAVDLDGNYMILGNSYETVGAALRAGGAYIYYKDQDGPNNWGEQTRITGDEEFEANARFGYSVSISGDYAIVGAPNKNSYTGEAYIFKKSGASWNRVALLDASDGEANDYFGQSVSISGDYLGGDFYAIVGAYGDDDAGSNAGAAYIFYKDEGGPDRWGQIQKITAGDGAADDSFGYSVSLSGVYAAIGAMWADSGGYTDNGAVYIFGHGRPDWIQEAKLVPDSYSEEFGRTVSIKGDYLIGGCPTGGPGDNGEAYVFFKNGTDWYQRAKLTASDAASDDNFGISVDINGSNAIVGSWKDDVACGVDAGSAYILSISACTPLNADFTDSNFLDCVSAELGTPGIVCQEDVNLLNSLDCSSQSISSFAGTEHLTALSSLTLSDNSISDISPLSGLTGLSFLLLNENDIGDISDLSGLTGMRNLDLSQNNIDDISALSGMTGMDMSLNLTDNSIEDISALSGMTSLPQLLLSSNNISDISPLSGLTSLTDLQLVNNNVSDLSPIGSDNGDLADFASGNTINISDNPLTDQTDLDEVDLLRSNGATVIHNIVVPVCGNGIVEGAEECDDSGESVTCDTNCTSAVCGDGTKNATAGETCDDGNTNNGDGCSATCKTEGGGGSRPPEPPTCTATLTKIDLPETLPVSQIGGKPTVVLNWSKIKAQEINSEQKIGILFDYFNQSNKPIIGTNKKRVENVFAKYIYGEIIKDAELASLLKSKIGETNYKNLIGCDCNNDLASTVTNAVKALRSNTQVKDRLNAIIVNFANDILAIEAVVAQADSGAETPFTDFYNTYFPSGVYEGMTVEIYRGGNLIHTEGNPNNTSYSDDGLPINNSGSVKYYNYYIITKNRCGDSSQGATGQAKIDPQIPVGTSVDVSLDLSIKVKDAYSILFMDKLKEILLPNDTANIMATGYSEGEQNMCEEMRQAFLVEKKNDKMFAYILECFAGYDFRLRTKLEEIKSNIVPPLLKMLQLHEDGDDRENIVEQFMYPLISELNLRFSLVDAAKENLGNLNLNIAALTGKQMSDLTESEMNEIRKIDEAVFEGASHSADLIIEKYDSDNKLLGSYMAHTDVFGIVKGVLIGQMTSGKDYTLKIRLKDVKYVLPHTVTLNVRNALLLGDKYKTSITLNFPKHFRYGDFNSDGEINLQDLIGWGLLLKDKPEEWQSGNLDGLQGINILDVLTLQQNWGKLEGTTFGQSQMPLGDFLKALGVSIISSSDSSLQAEVIIPGWLNVVSSLCP
jgi:cysteine-rich repeat protein